MKSQTTSTYGITISPSLHPGLCTAKHLSLVIANMARRVPSMIIIDCVLEISSHDYLHAHLLVIMRKNVYKKRLMKRGYSIRVDHLRRDNDILKWQAYIRKYQKNEYHTEDIVHQHAMRRFNLFNYFGRQKFNQFIKI